ncbi:CapA family protein [Halopseudomonas bauzanensis]|uniref:CapA family protein n=1 Tax=Halopseudomonas bauzanensis TaxID=653930 RepID=UPI0035239020
MLLQLLDQMRPAVARRVAALPAPWPQHTLFLSFSDGRRRAAVVHASGADFETLWAQLSAACQQRAARRNLKVRWLRADWVTQVQPMTWQVLKGSFKAFKRNYFRYGLALDGEFQTAFLEGELNGNAMLYGGSQVNHAQLNERNFRLYASQRFAGLEPDFADAAPVYLLTTEGLFCDLDTAPLALHATGRDAGRRVVDCDAATVQGLIERGSDYLASQVGQDGRFYYGWHPCFDRQINAYNTLRHASTLYSMLESWEVTREPALAQAIERGLDYLCSTLIKRVTLATGENVAFLVDVGNEIKLGGNAVCLLALVKHSELFGGDRYLALLEALALGIRQMQDPASGEFVHVLNYPALDVKAAFRIIYYDGEAAFGLMRLYSLTGDERWLAMVEKAFDSFIAREHWKAHDHWLGYCVNELTRYRPEERYFRFGMRNVADHLDFVLKRITTFPTLLELMMAARRMLDRIQQSPEHRHLLGEIDLDKFDRALHHRAAYLMNGHFWPEYAMYFRNPARILGSFFIRHQAFRVRIDDVEHYLSGYVAYWKMLTQLDPTPLSTTKEPEDEQATNPLPGTRPVVAWGGDVNLGRRQHYRTAELGSSNVLRIPALKEADLSIVNLECVVATQGEQGINKGEGGPYYYRARPQMLQVLIDANIDVVTTANNHSGDYGPGALQEQAAWLDAVGLGHTGSGAQREAAFTPVLRRAGDLNVAVFSIDATQHRYAAGDARPGTAYLALNDAAAWAAEMAPRIAAIRTRAHIVLIAVHWGDNLAKMPSAAQTAVGHGLIDAGADAVLGASAHVLQGIEIYRERPIIHDAGDLLFDSVRRDLGRSGVFRLELSHQGVERVVFVPIGVGFGFSEQLSGRAARAAVQAYARSCAATGSRLTLTEDNCGQITLTPPQRRQLWQVPAPRTVYQADALLALNSSEPGGLPGWTTDAVPADARIEPRQLGPLTLLGCRITPTTMDRRRMLWIESFWRCDAPVEEDIRLDFRAVPMTATRMKPWGISMDHDPCDWMMPTSRWQPGVIYRDYFGLRPPYLKDWENVDLQLVANIVSRQQASEPVPLPLVVRLAVPGKDVSPPAPAQAILPEQTWTAEQLEAVTGGEWLVRPPPGWFVRSLAAGPTHIDMLPNPVMFVAHTYEDRARHEQFSDMTKVRANNWDLHGKLAGLHTRLAGAIVAKPVAGLPADFPLLRVDDPFKAIIELGAANRRRIEQPVVAVTGSAGKTSTVHMLRDVVGEAMRVHATYDNYNSRCGALIVLASAPLDVELVVLEVAVSGTANRNMGLVAPDMSVITNIGTAHLKPGQTTLETARKKSGLFQHMKPGATAIICRDTEHFDFIADRARAARLSILTYGEHPESDIRLADYCLEEGVVAAVIAGEQVSYKLSVPGRHMAVNSLVCLAVARTIGLDHQVLHKGFAKTSAVAGRGAISETTIGSKRLRILDESYNANPLSMQASLEMFAAMTTAGDSRKVLVLGDMLELGDEAEAQHDRLLASIVACRPAQVYLVGGLMARLQDGLKREAIPCEIYATAGELLSPLGQGLQDEDLVLFKSSHGVGLHGVVKQLMASQ